MQFLTDKHAQLTQRLQEAEKRCQKLAEETKRQTEKVFTLNMDTHPYTPISSSRFTPPCGTSVTVWSDETISPVCVQLSENASRVAQETGQYRATVEQLSKEHAALAEHLQSQLQQRDLVRPTTSLPLPFFSL